MVGDPLEHLPQLLVLRLPGTPHPLPDLVGAIMQLDGGQ
jgi:hypothetical protein